MVSSIPVQLPGTGFCRIYGLSLTLTHVKAAQGRTFHRLIRDSYGAPGPCAVQSYKCVGPPYTLTKMFAVRMSHGSSSSRSISAAALPVPGLSSKPEPTGCPPLLLSIDGTDRQTDERTDTRPSYDYFRMMCGSRNTY